MPCITNNINFFHFRKNKKKKEENHAIKFTTNQHKGYHHRLQASENRAYDRINKDGEGNEGECHEDGIGTNSKSV